MDRNHTFLRARYGSPGQKTQALSVPAATVAASIPCCAATAGEARVRLSGRGPQHVVRRVDTARRSKSAQVHGGKSPTVYYDDQTDNYLLQGWKVLDPGCLAQMDVPDHETVIEFPKRMMQFFPEVNGSGGTDA